MAITSTLRRGFFALSCLSLTTYYCSDDQVLILILVLALALAFIVVVTVEYSSLRGATHQLYPTTSTTTTCRSPLATNPFLIVFLLAFAAIYVLFLDPLVSTQFHLNHHSNELKSMWHDLTKHSNSPTMLRLTRSVGNARYEKIRMSSAIPCEASLLIKKTWACWLLYPPDFWTRGHLTHGIMCIQQSRTRIWTNQCRKHERHGSTRRTWCKPFLS